MFAKNSPKPVLKCIWLFYKLIFGNKNQNRIIMINHKTELIKKAKGDIFLKKNSAADRIAKTFTIIIITLISLRVIK